MRDGSDPLRCCRCGSVKPAGEFHWRRKADNRRDSYCKPCRREYGREYYAANRDRRIEQDAARKRVVRLERTRSLLQFFAEHPCSDCGEPDPVVLEFDHLRDKRFSIGQKLTRMAWDTVLAEMEKCEVVCANCHRRRTFRRQGTVRLLLVEENRADGENRTLTFSLEG